MGDDLVLPEEAPVVFLTETHVALERHRDLARLYGDLQSAGTIDQRGALTLARCGAGLESIESFLLSTPIESFTRHPSSINHYAAMESLASGVLRAATMAAQAIIKWVLGLPAQLRKNLAQRIKELSSYERVCRDIEQLHARLDRLRRAKPDATVGVERQPLGEAIDALLQEELSAVAEVWTVGLDVAIGRGGVSLSALTERIVLALSSIDDVTLSLVEPALAGDADHSARFNLRRDGGAVASALELLSTLPPVAAAGGGLAAPSRAVLVAATQALAAPGTHPPQTRDELHLLLHQVIYSHSRHCGKLVRTVRGVNRSLSDRLDDLTNRFRTADAATQQTLIQCVERLNELNVVCNGLLGVIEQINAGLGRVIQIQAAYAEHGKRLAAQAR